MKNVTQAINRNFKCLPKALFSGLFGVVFFSLILTGCFWTRKRPKPAASVTQTPASSSVSEPAVTPSSSSTEGGTLPYGVTLQVDPSVLVPCKLERVVDGDTIIVHDPDNKRLRVRLTGINAPESVAEDESRNTEEGRIASKFLKDFLKDTKTVYLEYDVGRTDQYNRTLAYVWIKYESTYVMVNEVILASGHAKPVYIKPNLKYADDFRKYEK